MDNTTPFPSLNVRIMLLLYRLIWLVCLPLIIAYLYMRGRKDHTYFKHLSERFGFHRIRHEQHIWLHAVSLGEIRSAAPLIECLLQGSRPIVTTHFTPAGRREAERLFPAAVAEGRLTACYVPFDYSPALNRYFKDFRPAYGLVMEFEAWPGMIMSSRKIGLPLFCTTVNIPPMA
jgi:3-deoxy-D-manno-octulosonic-acid transferase